MDKYFREFDFSDFWDDDEYSLKEYVCEPVTTELIEKVESELGFKLPASYVQLMKMHNGGTPNKNSFPTQEPTCWAVDHVCITGIAAISFDKNYSLCGEMGSKFMQEEWGYPEIGICICDTPTAGHDMIMLDYRECGKEGEPKVVHVDQESDFKITFLAENFEAFISGLITEEAMEILHLENKNKKKSVQKMWEDFIEKMPEYKDQKMTDSYYFCDNEKDANECSELVFNGIKRATAGSKFCYDKESWDIPKVGDLTVITDWSGEATSIIKTTKVEFIPYKEITAEHAFIEGEGDKSLEYWRKVHWDYYTRELAKYNEKLSEEMIIIFEEFEKVFPV